MVAVNSLSVRSKCPASSTHADEKCNCIRWRSLWSMGTFMDIVITGDIVSEDCVNRDFQADEVFEGIL